MEEQEWHQSDSDNEMANEESSVAPSAYGFQTCCDEERKHGKAEYSNDDDRSRETLLENSYLNEEVQIPCCMADQETVYDTARYSMPRI